MERGSSSDQRFDWRNNYTGLLILAYQSFGVVYGDLSTSPLYVYPSSYAGKLQNHQNEETVFGLFSLIFWTFTLIPLLKYVVIVLSADDNGEGGTFALYSLLCRHAKFSLLPNQQAADEELSTYYPNGLTSSNTFSSSFKRFLEKYKKLRTFLLLTVLFGACMVIGEGVLSPAISVLSSISGLRVRVPGLKTGEVVIIACIMLVGLFALRHRGTHKISFLFAPVVFIWLLCIGAIGLYNIIHWNPKIFHALSPQYAYKFFAKTGKDGWISLGGVLLSITGTEAMFADLGRTGLTVAVQTQFTKASIRVAFGFIYPCLILQYMGQAAFLSKNIDAIPTSFYDSIPKPVFWPVFVISILAVIVASQAFISATFSIVKQCHALGCFPRVKVVHKSRWLYGQIYIPEINWILMIISLAIMIGFRDTTLIGNAYGVACMSVMFVTTWLMALVIVLVWQKNAYFALLFLSFFGFVEGVYLSSSLMKVPQGGWASIVLALVFMFVMYVWHYGTLRKYLFELQDRVSMNWITTLGNNREIARVHGIGVIYSELVSGVPAIFSQFVTSIPALYQVLVFVCIKSVPVPYVPPHERYLLGRIGPRCCRMYRCIVRYGYKDVQKVDENFENLLVLSIAKFIQIEAAAGSCNSSPEGRMAVIHQPSELSGSMLVMRNAEQGTDAASSKSGALQRLQSLYEQEYPSMSRRRLVHFALAEVKQYANPEMRDELQGLIEAKEEGTAYILGHSYIKARKTSSFLKKFVIDAAYSFLRKNCRGPSVALHIPHVSLIQVGMIYHV